MFWLYIGQASDFSDRMKNHNDPLRRYRNPSLHYHIWDSIDDIKSVFVTLATYKKPQCVEDQLILNLGEMWMCLIFQTLRPLHLEQFLPEDVQPLWSGNHLNVALPLWQGFTDKMKNLQEAIGNRHDFQQYLQSEDQFVRAWAESTRDAFNDLRNSPNPVLRDYYRGHLLRRLEKAQKTWAAKKAERSKSHLSGFKEKVRMSGDHIEVTSGNFKFTISRKLGLDLVHDDEVILQYHLTTTQHPHKYALKALPTDPASRLGVSIRGQDSKGPFHRWLMTSGSLNVFKINSLVDHLEGYSLEDTKMFKRRWYHKKIGNHHSANYSRKVIYT